jgi:hypothetical protein
MMMAPASAAARSEFAAESPDLQLPGEGNANAARAFVSAWVAACAGKHLRKVFALLQLGSIAEIAPSLDAEFLAFCSRCNGARDDAHCIFDATVSQQQQRAKARNAPWSWASIWLFFHDAAGQTSSSRRAASVKPGSAKRCRPVEPRTRGAVLHRGCYSPTSRWRFMRIARRFLWPPWPTRLHRARGSGLLRAQKSPAHG